MDMLIVAADWNPQTGAHDTSTSHIPGLLLCCEQLVATNNRHTVYVQTAPLIYGKTAHQTKHELTWSQ